MHFLHIFNTCTVTDLTYKGEEKTYYTKDYSIRLTMIKRAPDALYHLVIARKEKDSFTLGKAQTSTGRIVFECDCFITAENYEVLRLCGLDGKTQRFSIVIQKTFCL